MMTFFAPASMCFWPVSLVRNRPVDDQRVAVDRDRAFEAAVYGVVLQHVGEVLGFEQVVDADDLDLVEVLDGGTKHHAPDAAEAVDADLDGHWKTLLGIKGNLNAFSARP
jgi:hypothetical protein